LEADAGTDSREIAPQNRDLGWPGLQPVKFLRALRDRACPQASARPQKEEEKPPRNGVCSFTHQTNMKADSRLLFTAGMIKDSTGPAGASISPPLRSTKGRSVPLHSGDGAAFAQACIEEEKPGKPPRIATP